MQQILRQKLLSRDIWWWSRDRIIVQRDKNFQSYDKTVIASIPQNIGFVQY